MDARPLKLRLKTGVMVSALGAILLTGCATPGPAATPSVTVATSPRPTGVTFNPTTSGRLLAAKIAARETAAGISFSGVECRNFPNIKVGTHTDCQMRVNGVKQGLRATFAERDGHFVLKVQSLTW